MCSLPNDLKVLSISPIKLFAVFLYVEDAKSFDQPLL